MVRNINDDPDFVYGSEPYGYYHIKYDSPAALFGLHSISNAQQRTTWRDKRTKT